jgi:outer membrane protein assembly factor BamB
MRFSRSKATTIVIALFLMFAIAVSLVALPAATAQEVGTLKTYAYIGATPNPIGVGQETLIHVGITSPQANVALGWEGLTVTVTRPDGTTDTLGPYRTDATGGTGDVYVPTMVGNYTLQTHFPEQVCENDIRGYGTFFPSVPAGTVMLASKSEPLTLVVQEEPLPVHPGHPLPTEYWTRPIDAQLREWNSIAGNWLTPPSLMGFQGVAAPYNDYAPETAHILWAKPMQMGGLAGGVEFGPQAYECGDAYEGLYLGSVTLGGVLYYHAHKEGFPTQTVVAVDLHTGEELWNKPLIGPDNVSRRLSFGQVFYWDSYNYHAVFPYLWTTSGGFGFYGPPTPEIWNAFDPFDGSWVYSMEDVPSGTSIRGEKGEIYRYNVNTADGWMTLWNSSRVVRSEGSWLGGFGGAGHGQVFNASRGIEWNITIPEGLPGSVREVVLGDRVVGTRLTTTEVNSWAFSLKPGQEGTLLFNNAWKPPVEWATGNITINTGVLSLEDDVFTLIIPQWRQHYGFSIETGQKIWGPTEPQYYLDYLVMNAFYCDGKVISSCMSGIIYAYDIKTGELLWTYEAYDPLNEILWSDNWPMRVVISTDGKLYFTHSEHSPIDPKPRGAPWICLNATTGEEIWRIDGAFRGTEWGGYAIIGDSIIATMDTYDQRIYAIGKGPSATTVTAGPEVSVHGNSVLVKGMVTDVSPGTQEYSKTARFPNGVPAVADENMSDWMLYVYKQFERPADVVGVEVVLEVLDPNNNYYEVGRTTSDSDGFFKLAFTPEVPGEYTIIASFAGSGAYYGSHAKTAINVEEAPAATPPPTPTPAPMTDTYVTGFGIGIIIAIVIGFALLLLRKR